MQTEETRAPIDTPSFVEDRAPGSGSVGRSGSGVRGRERTNARWLADLRSDGSGRERATGDLAEYLHAGLARALGSADNVRPSDLEDFVQDALIRILEAIGSFRGESRFTTWAMTIALRAAYSELRKRRSAHVSLSDVETYARVVGSGGLHVASRAEREVQRDDLLEALRRAIMEELTERQRTVILAVLRGATSNRIAEMLGSNRNAVYKVYHDARKKLRAALTDAGFTATDVRAVLVEA